ncbi:hypothetical protein [Flavivirga eckloniae]|uniref:Uncharacterized protein n=1 Tax=Flavivirga eckloniae TaxID=1803846 RepID=A0A2K9PSX8_9FLAO|nr:hypothetical protein [Flavivirga eckloniae]AUP80166.1 hypothetical protein C1H87_16205 [Flavivirga eckloniae]
MNKLFSIVVSLLFVFQSSNVHFNDIVQIDELLEHACFHKKQYGDNFLVFLSKHYGNQKEEHSKKNQEEKEDHRQLPFQHQGHVASVMVFVIKQHPIQLEHLHLEANQVKIDNFYYQMPYTSLYNSRVFQPPKQA